jgi:hypothetical protein
MMKMTGKVRLGVGKYGNAAFGALPNYQITTVG